MRVTFCLADRKAPRTTRIVAFVHWDNEQAKIATGLHVAPKDWNQKKRRTRNTAPGGEQIDVALASMESKVAELAAKVAATGQRVTREQIRATLTTPTTRQRSRRLVDLYDVFLEEAKGRLQPGSIGSHRVTRNHVERFEKAYGITLDLDNLDTVHLDKFRSYLTDVRRIINSTLAAQAKNLRVVLNRAVANGETVNPAFKKFRFKTPQSDGIALTFQEIAQIRELDLHHEQRLSEARDCFVFQYMTSLRYSDLRAVRPENIDGKTLRLTAQKTGETLTIRLHEWAITILERYSNRLPVPALTLYNERLRAIALRTGLTQLRQVVTFRGVERIVRVLATCELVSSHVARRSNVTTLKAEGAQDKVIMTQSGHKNPAMIAQYNRVSEESAGDVIEAIFNKLEATLGAADQRDATRST